MDKALELLEKRIDQDVDLVDRARGGDREAFDDLFQRHKSFVYSVCYRMLGSTEDAVDAMQGTFIKAYRGLRGFNLHSSFRSWLYRIAVNEATSIIRRQRRRGDIERQVEAPREAVEDHDNVWQAVLTLPPNYRSVIVLFYFQGLNVEEIAESLGCSKVNVATRLHRARAALRKKLEELER